MKAITILLFATMLMAAFYAQTVPVETAKRASMVADVEATRFLAYRTATVQYLNANNVSDTAIAWADLAPYAPMGYSNAGDPWRNRVEGDKLYVYSASPVAAETLTIVYQNMQRSLLVGTAQAGTLTSPSGMNTGITLPASIPDGVLVIVGN